jgi:hypothetical protein
MTPIQKYFALTASSDALGGLLYATSQPNILSLKPIVYEI